MVWLRLNGLCFIKSFLVLNILPHNPHLNSWRYCCVDDTPETTVCLNHQVSSGISHFPSMKYLQVLNVWEWLFFPWIIKGTLSPKIIFEYVKQSWPLVIRSLVFCSRNSKKERKYIFSKISRDSVYLKNEYRKRKVCLKTFW